MFFSRQPDKLFCKENVYGPLFLIQNIEMFFDRIYIIALCGPSQRSDKALRREGSTIPVSTQ